jgi:MoaA/NifB/PqqE/SkfB family radical SAM enzyme
MTSASAQPPSRGLTARFERGLTAPVCLTWELTYACNLACVHCLSSSGRRDPRELTTSECRTVIDTLQYAGAARMTSRWPRWSGWPRPGSADSSCRW